MVGFLQDFDGSKMLEKALEHIDMERIIADVMKDLQILDLEMYFVVDQQPDCDGYDFLGMAYSMKSAVAIMTEANTYAPEILKLDIAKLVPLAKKLGFVEKVS
ncbi:hypothetical protein LCGC14_1001450 [marine sediment metagenome]|uniref:Uncharacterized protein n=1 Tax=marine sediment metagenome TaxID=412755 RepID=A0A0F9QLC0_9ZZZZ